MEKLPKFESSVNQESAEKYVSRIKLNFMRHAEKAESYSDNDKVDSKVTLTSRGKREAKEKAKEFPNPQKMGIASSRDRAQETALFALAGTEEGITGEESIDELWEKVDKDIKYGSRLGVDARLDFGFSKDDPEFLELQEAFEEGTYLKKLIENHNQVVQEKGKDYGDSAYSKQARNIASLIKKYVGMAPRWNQLVKDKSKSYDDTLERVITTHGGISESFLAELIGQLKGAEELNRFIDIFPNGFDYLKGFEVDVLTMADGSLKIHLKMEVSREGGEIYLFENNVPVEILNKIIKDNSPKE
jgi:broad specificity phosphatase PhoE